MNIIECCIKSRTSKTVNFPLPGSGVTICEKTSVMIRLFACVVAAIALPKYPILLPIILTLLYGWTLLRRHLQV